MEQRWLEGDKECYRNGKLLAESWVSERGHESFRQSLAQDSFIKCRMLVLGIC